MCPRRFHPNIRPYHYPFHQNIEIEMLFQDLLKQGIIFPSTSSFSSPVPLVQKKYGSWCLCIEFRALNHSQSRISFQFLLLMSFMVLIFSPTWIFVLDITKFRFMRMISLKRTFAHMMATISLWSWPLFSQIFLPHSMH